MWKSSVVLLSSLALLSLVVSAIPGAYAARPSAHLSIEERALVEHLDGEYGMDLADRLSSFSFRYGGEVVPGSSEELQVAEYLAKEMEMLGLDDVTIDPFTLVNWNYKLASLEITSPTVEVPSIDTRSMANSPSTPAGGVEGLLVDVGLGRNIDFDAVGSVEGKIVLIERSVVMWYTTPAVREAGYRGAIGALIYNIWRSPEALNVDTAHNSIPTLSIRAVDAMYLKELLATGPVRLKMEVLNEINENAQAHAVYGYIWGSKYPDEYIVLEGHYDHWWNGVNDDNGGVASSLAIAKAIKDAGIVPKRTLVFMALSGHESGTGGSKESFWDWGLGGYYFMNVVHPEWSKKVVWSSISDGGGVKASWMFVETTPELAGFLKQVGLDVSTKSLMVPYVFTPVSSFDSWGFYMAGVPTSSFYYGAPLSSAVEEYYYHTDLEGMFLLDPAYMEMDAAFRGVAGLRISQSEVLPYNFEGTVKEMDRTLEKLTDAVPDADVTALTASLNAFERKAGTFNDYVKELKNPAQGTVKEINSKLIKVVNTVNPLLWDQDIGYYNPYPGWCSVTKFETFMNDMSRLEGAVKALNMEDNVGALKNLANVVTMSWGQYVSYPVYLDVVWLFNGTPYLNWATGHLPWLTNVHQDCTAIASGEFDYQEEIANLSAKLGVLFDKLDLTAASVKLAFDSGTAIIATI